MAMRLNFKFFNGFWSLMGKIGFKLSQMIPLYILIFIAYGDVFLPPPLSNASFTARTAINNLLTGAIAEDFLENNKYDNKKVDRIIQETEEKYRDSSEK